MLTNEEKNWIRKMHTSGYATKDDFPNLGEDERIPFIAVPNMRKPDGSLRSFEVKEIMEALDG